jgi:hypothetical protein
MALTIPAETSNNQTATYDNFSLHRKSLLECNKTQNTMELNPEQ